MPATSSATPKSRRDNDPTSGSSVADACSMLVTSTPAVKNTAAATMIMAELTSQPIPMASVRVDDLVVHQAAVLRGVRCSSRATG